jgi:predicted TIM-barrel fold metal-dependent hydrolase
MAALTAFAPPTQYLFGTDWPAEPMESTLDELPKNNLSPQVMAALNRGNAEKLWPRFKS